MSEMLSVIIKIVVGGLLSVLALYLTALVLGERRTLRKTSADYNTFLGKSIRMSLFVLVLLIAVVIALSYYANLWFLLILIPSVLLGVALLLPQMSKTMAKKSLDSKSEREYEAARARVTNKRAYECKKCGKAILSLDEAIEYRGGIYCKTCVPKQVDNKPVEKKQIVNKHINSQKTILLVDDDVHIRKLYTEEFSEVFGDRVKTIAFSDGISAFDFFKENLNNVHLVISNILMPGIDGIKFLKLCKKLAPNIPFIICTSYDHNEAMQKATSEADAYIVKGADFLSELLDAVRKLLDIDDDSRVLKEVNLRENKKPIETHNKVSSNQQVEDLPPIPVAYGSAFEGEMIKKEDMFIEFGGQRTPSFEWVRMKELDEIEDNKVIVVGTDRQARYANGGQMPLGIVIDVAGRTMQKDFESIIEKKVHHNINEAQGLWHMGQRDLNWIRINHNAKKEGFALEHIGYIMTTMTHHRFKSIVDKVQVTIYVDEKDVLAVLEDARKAYKERDHQAHSKTQEKEIALYKKGDFIGQKYEVFGVLGEGGFGIVYLVYSHETKSAYALKTFRDEYLEDVTTRERFKKEAQVWINLERHPYLVRAYFVDEISGRLFIAVEHIAPDDEGLNTLEGYLRSRPPDMAQTLRWAIQFCYGMEYAYSKGIKAHRDIKPANIMIGQDKAVKISDFGLAGVVSTSKPLSGIKINPQHNISVSGEAYQTMEGSAFGTPPYMPPEQFENAAGCDERSDIYSFGIVLYQMASGGKLPFLPEMAGDMDDNLFQNWYMLHCKAPVPKLKSPLFPIIFRCLEKKPINRYFSFKELRRDFETMLKKQTGEVVKVPELKELEAWELVNKGNSLGRLGKEKEAIACYDRALEINPRFAEAWNNKGTSLGRLGKEKEAIACINRALKINPRDAEAWSNKGTALEMLGKHQEAIACHDRAIEINPRHAEAWLNKGAALEMLDKHQEAIACFDNALEINPGYADAWYNKGAVLRGLDKHQEAIICYDKALELNPGYAAAWYFKGNILASIGKNQEAIVCFDRAIKINPAHAVALFIKGVVLNELGESQEALVCYEKALKIDPMDAMVWYNKGIALKMLGKYQEAIACYDRALEINPIYAAAWVGKGVALGSLGKYQEAIPCYDRAIEINPMDAEAWYNKGVALESLGKHQEAIAYFNSVLEINPKCAEAWNNKGVALGSLGKYQEAIPCYDRALEINPRDAAAWTNKGVALGHLGKSAEAIACFNRALEINPEYAAAWTNKGAALGSLGKHQEAIACYDRALEINPRYAMAWFGRAFAEDKRNKTQEAIISYKQFLRLASGHDAALIAHARKRLEELKGK